MLAKPRTKLNKGLREIYAADSSFSPKQFLSGADMAYDTIYATEEPSKEAYRKIVLYELEMIELFAIAISVLILSLSHY